MYSEIDTLNCCNMYFTSYCTYSLQRLTIVLKVYFVYNIISFVKTIFVKVHFNNLSRTLWKELYIYIFYIDAVV